MSLGTGDSELRSALNDYAEAIAAEVLATDYAVLDQATGGVEHDIDGRTLSISLERA